MANIKNFIQHPGAIYNDNSLTINAQQNATQNNFQPSVSAGDALHSPETETATAPAKQRKSTKRPKDESSFSNLAFNKDEQHIVDMLRIINAFTKMDPPLFLDKRTNRKPEDKEIIEAFCTAAGLDPNQYYNNFRGDKTLSNGSTRDTDIFDKLKQAALKK